MKQLTIMLLVLGASALVATTTAAANSATPNTTITTAKLLRRCEFNYEEEEIQAMRDDGEDMYEPDDCPPMSHILTGPMTFNFCQGGDEDWIRFKARAGIIYQIRATPRWNYPTEPHLDLYDPDTNLVMQNDHYFDRNAELWFWNTGGDRWIYLRATELRGRHDCGNDAYTVTLNSFTENPYPNAMVTPTITITPTATITPTISLTPTTAIPLTDTLMITATVTATPTK